MLLWDKYPIFDLMKECKPYECKSCLDLLFQPLYHFYPKASDVPALEISSANIVNTDWARTRLLTHHCPSW